MPSKQGGKGKQSSPSRKASHQRGPARTAANRLKKIARHAKRMGLSQAQIGAATQTPEFPRVQAKPEKTRVSFGGQISANYSGLPMHLVFVSGHLVEISPHSVDADRAKREANTRHAYSHELLNPLTGRRTLIASRPAS